MTIDDFVDDIKRIFPKGAIWIIPPGSYREKLLYVLADTFFPAQQQFQQLPNEADPRQTTALLPEWETTTGLPDACLPSGGTTQERRNAVVARLVSTGGADAAYFIGLAAAYGYVITIDYPALFTWRANASVSVGITWATCLSSCVDPLRTWGNDQLECLLNRVKPAHTVLLFAYAS